MVTSKTLFANFDYWSVVAGFSILSKRTKWAKTNKNTDFEIGHSPHIPNNVTEPSCLKSRAICGKLTRIVRFRRDYDLAIFPNRVQNTAN